MGGGGGVGFSAKERAFGSTPGLEANHDNSLLSLLQFLSFTIFVVLVSKNMLQTVPGRIDG